MLVQQNNNSSDSEEIPLVITPRVQRQGHETKLIIGVVNDWNGGKKRIACKLIFFSFTHSIFEMHKSNLMISPTQLYRLRVTRTHYNAVNIT